MAVGYLTRCTLLDNVAVASTASQESGALPLQYVSQIESVMCKAASASGTADVKIEYITSPDGTNYEAYADTLDITASTLTDKAGNAEGFNPFPMPALIPSNLYIKFKVTGVNLNPADTLVTLYALLREGMRV
jgi:hypothetical protein